MKTITKFIYAAFAAVILATGAVTANGAVNDLFASVNGNGDNGGGFIYQFTPTGVQTTFASGLSRPRGVAFDHFGNLFVVTNTFDSVSGTFQPSIVKITPGGVQSTFATISGDFFGSGLAIDGSGNVFVIAVDDTSQTFASTIYKFTPGGVQSTFGSVPSQGAGLAFDSAGNLFAADFADITIYKFTPDGTRSVFVDPSAFLPDQGPVGLAFDRFGNLFVSTEIGGVPPPSGEGEILKFTPDGMGTTFADVHNYARGLAFDRAGNLFVAEVGENPDPNVPAPGDILKVTSNGVGTVFADNIVPGGNNSGPEFLAVQPATPRPRPTPHPRPL
jgi:sugar lactone lactonase YvrE